MKRSLIIIAVVASIIALLSYLYWDRALAYYFSTNPYGIHKIFSYITELGLSEYYLIPSFLLFLLAKGRREKLSKGALFLFLSVALSGIFIIIIKIETDGTRTHNYHLRRVELYPIKLQSLTFIYILESKVLK